jgi:predicted peroxiredoxin
MQILFNVLTGTKDATRASIPLHLAVNGSLEVGDQPVVLLAGDGTEYLVGDAIDHAEGIGLPAFRDLVAKLREHEVPVYV